MKAFVGLCGPLDGGLLAFWGLRHLHSSCFSYQEHNTKGAFMPFIINVGVSRKASKDFQSTGYSLNLTAELDSGLLADSNRLQNEIERIYSQATIALNRQVEGSGPPQIWWTLRIGEFDLARRSVSLGIIFGHSASIHTRVSSARRQSCAC